MAFNGNVSFRIGISACKFLPLVELKCEIQGQVDVSMWSDDYFAQQDPAEPAELALSLSKFSARVQESRFLPVQQQQLCDDHPSFGFGRYDFSFEGIAFLLVTIFLLIHFRALMVGTPTPPPGATSHSWEPSIPFGIHLFSTRQTTWLFILRRSFSEVWRVENE